MADWDLRPAMTLRTRVIGTQVLSEGDTVGYGSTFTAPGPLRIGVVACGYADGYPRHAPTGTPVLVDGVRTRVVGRVSMDMITVDLTPAPPRRAPPAPRACSPRRGGGGPPPASGGPRPVLPIDEVAHAAGTIGYELMGAVAPRVAKHVAPLAG